MWNVPDAVGNFYSVINSASTSIFEITCEMQEAHNL